MDENDLWTPHPRNPTNTQVIFSINRAFILSKKSHFSRGERERPSNFSFKKVKEDDESNSFKDEINLRGCFHDDDDVHACCW